MYSKQTIIKIIVSACILSLASIKSASAATCGNTDTNIISCGNGNAIWDMLLLAINILAAGVGLVAVGGVVYGATLYATAQNNSGQITKAKTAIANTVFGLIAFALMYSFLQYLIPGGFVNSLTNPPSIPPPSVATNSPPSDRGDKKGTSQKFDDFKIAGFNILGSKHTDTPGGNKYGSGWSSAKVRLPRAMKALKDSGVSVAALLEVYPDQRKILSEQYSRDWGLAAGDANGQGRAVVWDKNKWRKIEVKFIDVPAAGTKRQPFVLLEQISTKKRIWFMGVHNVAGHDATNLKKREISLQRELAAIKAVRGDKHPIFIAGDFNDRKDGRSSAQCYLKADMTNVFGSNGSGVCGKPNADTAVDHIFYIDASAVRVKSANDNKSVMQGSLSSRITDHPLVVATIVPR